MGLICFICDEEILKEDRRIMVAIEVPYVNLYMHKDCHDKILDLSAFLTQNVEKIYNIDIKSEKKGKNDRKTK
jgi:hypothetical protein